MRKIKLFSNNRSSVVLKNIFGSFVVKGFSILITLFLVPVTVKILNQEKYGVWLTLFSIVSWFNMMDVGIGNGFRNKFTEAVSKNEKIAAKQLMQTFYAVMALVSAGIFMVYLCIHPFLNWHNILNVSLKFDENIGSIVLFTFGLFCMQLYLKNITTVLLALHKTTISNLLFFLGNLVALLAIFVLNAFHHVSLLSIATVYMVAPNVVFLVASILLFQTSLREYNPFPLKIYSPRLKSLVGLGFKFFFIQITTIIMFSSDNIIITQLFGPAEVTPYNIAYRLFFSVYGCFTIVMVPFWAAFGEASARDDKAWINQSLKKLMAFWAAFSIGIVIILFLSNYIYTIWIGNLVIVPFKLSMQLALFAIIISWTSIFSYFLNGVGKIQIQLYIAIFQCIFNIPLAIILAKYFNMGTTGIILATNLNLLISAVLLSYQVYIITNNRANGIWAK